MEPVLSDIHVYGIEKAVLGSKYPMVTDVDHVDSGITDTVRKLGAAKPGTGHDTFLNGIIVQFDLTFTVKAWTEAQRYHFFEFISSQSTMHRISRFDLDNQYIKYVDPRVIEIMKEKVAAYNDETDPDAKRTRYLELLYTNPTGFKLTAAMTTNYRQLKTMVLQRKDHRLPEWRMFCKQVLELPHFRELCGLEDVEVMVFD